MSLEGIRYRMGRMFGPSGRDPVVLFPVDHGLSLGHVRGLLRPARAMEEAIAHGADGILASPALFQRTVDRFAFRGAPFRVATMDVYHVGPDGAHDQRLVADPAEAAVAGADAVKVLFVWGLNFSDRMRMVGDVARLIQDAHRHGLPCIVEPTLFGIQMQGEERRGLLADVARVALELGADVLKLEYPGDPGVLTGWCEQFEVPILLLGGTLSADPLKILTDVAEAIRAGASGIAIGRNIWQRVDVDPWVYLRALSDLVHGRRSEAQVRIEIEAAVGLHA